MTGDVLVLRYATALIELSEEEKVQAEIGSQLSDFASACGQGDLMKVLLDPSCSQTDKAAILGDVAAKLKLSDLFKNFLMVLLENKRLGLIAAINEAFQALFDEKAGRVKAEVVLPYEPDKAESEEIRIGLEKATGKDVVMDVTVDPELIGGVVAKVGSLVYDGSVRTQLENIKNNIMRG